MADVHDDLDSARRNTLQLHFSCVQVRILGFALTPRGVEATWVEHANLLPSRVVLAAVTVEPVLPAIYDGMDRVEVVEFGGFNGTSATRLIFRIAAVLFRHLQSAKRGRTPPNDGPFTVTDKMLVRTVVDRSGMPADLPSWDRLREQVEAEFLNARKSRMRWIEPNSSANDDGEDDPLRRRFLSLIVDEQRGEVRRVGEKYQHSGVSFDVDSAEWHTFLVAWRAKETGATRAQWENSYPGILNAESMRSVKSRVNDKLHVLDIMLAHRIPPTLIEKPAT